MNVCQIVASDAHGGLEKHVCELSQALADVASITIIAPPGLADRIPSGVRFIPLNFKVGRNNPLLLARLALTLREGQFDIVHAQANKAVAMLGTIRRWVPGLLLGTLHNQKSNTRMFARLDHAIAVSRDLAARLPAEVPHTVIYNGLSTKAASFEPLSRKQLCEAFELDASRPVLLSIGRLVPAKGFDVLIDACAPLEVNLLIAGEGFERTRLESLASRPMTAHVRLLGYRGDVPALMAAADGVVIASRVEGFSYVFAEAMLAGKPVVSTDVPVANELLPPEFLALRNDALALRKVIEYALDDTRRWTLGMQAARGFALQHFTLEHMASATLRLYRQLLGPKV